MPEPNLTGAYGIPARPSPAVLRHPERAAVVARGLTLLWVLRLGVLGVLLFVLYSTHVI